MEDMLQIQIEFSEDKAQGKITKEAIATTVKEAFLGIGIEPSVVQAGVDIDLDRESSLGVDPGAAALVIATIGVGMDLIKIAVDLYKQHSEQKLELAKLQLEREKFEFEKQQLAAKSLTDDDSKADQERIRDFLDSVLIARLIEQHRIQNPEYRFDVVQRW